MQYQVGQTVEFKRVFMQSDYDRFAVLSGDDNPIHCDPEFAKKSAFGGTVAHGMMLYSTICKGLSELIPGPNMVQMEQELMFPNGTFTDEEVTIRLEITEIHPDHSLDIATNIFKWDAQDTKVFVTQGRTRVMPAAL